MLKKNSLLTTKTKASEFLIQNHFKEREEIINWSIDKALSLGANEVGISTALGHSLGVTTRNGVLDSFEHSISSDFNLIIYCNHSFGVYSTNNFEKTSLENFIVKAIQNTKELEPDEYRYLPDPTSYYNKQNYEKLDLFDPHYSRINLDEQFNHPIRLEKQLQALKSPYLFQSSANYNNDAIYHIIATSNGFQGYSAKTYFGVSLSATVKDKSEARPSDYSFEHNRHYHELEKKLSQSEPHLAQEALNRAVNKLGQRPHSSGQFDAVVEHRVVGKLLSPILYAMSGSALDKHRSFLINKNLKDLFSKALTLEDNPHTQQGLGGKLFNTEGQPLTERLLIDRGSINQYLLNYYYSRKLNKEYTGSELGMLRISPGEYSLDQLCQKMQKGILIRGFNGGNCNDTTGNFSYGIEGNWVENGKISSPLAEMNVTGNMLDLWHNLQCVGNDIPLNTARQFPSLLFSNLHFSGL